MLPVATTSSLNQLNADGAGYVVLSSAFGLSKDFIESAKLMEANKQFPFNAESTYFVRDFDSYDLRNQPDSMTKEVAELFKLSDEVKAMIERDVEYDPATSNWILAFAELRVDNQKEKYSKPHLDQEINDFVVIIPITRDQGTLVWNPIEKQWYQSPVNGSPLFISTSKRPKPTLHQAPSRSTGSAFVLRYRLVKSESVQPF